MALYPISFGRGRLTHNGHSLGNVTSFQVEPWQTIYEKKKCQGGRVIRNHTVLVETGEQGTFIVDHITAKALELFSGGTDRSGYIAIGTLVFTGLNPIENVIPIVTLRNCLISGGSFELITQGFMTIPFRFRSQDSDIEFSEWQHIE